MSRIRSIHPGLFTDEAFVELPMAARMLLVGIWTEADDHGVFEWKPLSLKMKLFPADNIEVEPLMADLFNSGTVAQFTHAGKKYGAVRNFCKYQRPKKPTYRHVLPDEWRDYVGLKADNPSPVPHQLPTATEIVPQREDGGGKGEGKEEKKESRSVAKATRPADDAFEAFWKAYPKRGGANPKHPAAKLFDRAVKSGVDPGAIIAAAKRCAEVEHKRIGTEFIPRATTWLSERRWGDYVAQPVETLSSAQVFIMEGTKQWDAWQAKGRTPVKNGGWWFDSEWPADYQREAAA